jgi:hypothetical protein
MDRRSFLIKFGLGVGAVLVAPKIIASSIIKPGAPELIDSDFQWNSGEIFFRVINNNPQPTDVMLFGLMKNITGNFVPPGIKIFIAGHSIEDLNNMILYQPVRICGFKMKVKNPSQFSNCINLYCEHRHGAIEHKIFQPLNYRALPSQVVTQIDAPSFELLLTPEIYIMNTVNPNEQVDYIFSIAERGMGRNWEGRQYEYTPLPVISHIHPNHPEQDYLQMRKYTK